MVRVAEHAGFGQTYVPTHISVRIKDASGKPVGKIPVQLIDMTLERPVASGVTGADGTWTVELVPARTVRVVPQGGVFSPAEQLVTSSIPPAVVSFVRMS